MDPEIRFTPRDQAVRFCSYLHLSKVRSQRWTHFVGNFEAQFGEKKENMSVHKMPKHKYSNRKESLSRNLGVFRKIQRLPGSPIRMLGFEQETLV